MDCLSLKDHDAPSESWFYKQQAYILGLTCREGQLPFRGAGIFNDASARMKGAEEGPRAGLLGDGGGRGRKNFEK